MKAFRSSYPVAFSIVFVLSVLLSSQNLSSAQNRWCIVKSKSGGDIELQFQVPENIKD